MFACTDLTNLRMGACIFFGAGAIVVVCITVSMLKGGGEGARKDCCFQKTSAS